MYLAVVQGSISAGQSLSFGPSKAPQPTTKVLLLIIYTDISQAFAAANRIRGMRPQLEGGNKAASFDLHNLDGGEKEPQGVKIELKNVVFQYPTRDVPVLNGLNMTVRVNI